MFSHLARFATRYRLLIVIAWIAIAAALFFYAPSLSEVGVSDDTQFLPRDTESARAQSLLQEKFTAAADEPAGSALIVQYNPEGLGQNDNQTAGELHDWLLSGEAPSVVTGVTSIFESDALRSILVSQDGTAMIMRVDLSKASSSAPAIEAVQSIREHIQSQHPNSQIYLTGPAGISSDILTSIQQTIDKATLVTIILVIFLLLLIYRSPVAMLVPLITIGISYIVARGLAGYLAASESMFPAWWTPTWW
jgi:RND superfamily putative drug exporter